MKRSAKKPGSRPDIVPCNGARTADPCLPIQVDLSCMLDGEADETSVRRALIHIEACHKCRGFFETIRGHLQLHRDLCDPRLLMRSLRSMDGAGIFNRSSIKVNLRRLSVFFYRLGKAYLLLATDKRYLLEIFEEPVPISTYKTRGRGFVDGLFARAGFSEAKGGDTSKPEDRVRDGLSDRCQGSYPLGGIRSDLGVDDSPIGQNSSPQSKYDWVKARSLLNGRLEKVSENFEKAHILLTEALLVRPGFAEARLYLGFYHQAMGDFERAEQEYRRVFETARKQRNRAHAAVQLGVIMHDSGKYRASLRCFQWVARNGIVRRDPRFYLVYYNLALLFARLDDFERCVKCFRILMTRFPDKESDVRGYMKRAHAFLNLLSREPKLAEELARECPALFNPSAPALGDSDSDRIDRLNSPDDGRGEGCSEDDCSRDANTGDTDREGGLGERGGI